MPVRGTTEWQHARILKRVINMDRGGNVACGWPECTKYGYENHKIVQHTHARGIPCDHPLASHWTIIFCSDKCRMYWWSCTGANARELEERYNGHVMGNLLPGYKNLL